MAKWAFGILWQSCVHYIDFLRCLRGSEPLHSSIEEKRNPIGRWAPLGGVRYFGHFDYLFVVFGTLVVFYESTSALSHGGRGPSVERRSSWYTLT